MSISPRDNGNPRRRFRELLASSKLSIMPGGFSPLYARMAEAAGFDCLFVAGSQTSAFCTECPVDEAVGKIKAAVALEDWTQRMRETPWGLPDQAALVGAPRIRDLEEQFLPQRLQRDYATTFGH